MSNKVSMRRRGKFYSVYDDDAYVLYGLMKYKIIKNRVGFPVEALGKVQEILEENRVDYVVTDNDKEVLRRKFSNNHYEKFFNEGKKYYNKFRDEKDFIEKIKKLDEEKVDLIVEFIREVAYSG